MKCQRRILGIRWNDFITNRAVADRTNLPGILSTIAASRHSIFGHICRLSDSTPTHKALKLAMNARSGDTPHHGWNLPAGRPRTSWISQILRDTGLTAADTWTVADDRSTLRLLRPTAGYAQQWVSECSQKLVKIVKLQWWGQYGEVLKKQLCPVCQIY